MALELLVLHVPKTGGTALKGAMQAHFGDALAMDYADRPPVLEGRSALIGHFPATRYDALEAEVRLTVLRDPLERTLSEYFHFRSAPPRSNPIWQAVHAGEVAPLAYIERPTVRRAYTGYYFADCDMSRFRVIGHERLRAEWPTVMASLGLPTRPRAAQVRAEIMPSYEADKAALLADPVFARRAAELLAEDRAFFERWAV